MSVLELPVNSDSASYTFKVDIEGSTYGFELAYNSRSDRWSMTILNVDGNIILAGISLLANRDLIGRFRNLDLPPGRFVCQDTQGENLSPGRDDLGGRVKLLYVESGT